MHKHWQTTFAQSLLVCLLVVLESSKLTAQYPTERQLTSNAGGHMLTNIGVWSPDSKWIVYDTRSSLDGSVFNGQTIERVDVETGRVELLYRSTGGACCGVVTYHPKLDRVVFILGPEAPTSDWSYGPTKRQGVLVDCARPGVAVKLDARDLIPPFTPGALRGGTHVHTYSGDGLLVASTYEDAVLEAQEKSAAASGKTPERNLRGIAISLLDRPVEVPTTDPRNHSGSSFTFLATQLWDQPVAGSDQIMRACEEGWIGEQGYVDRDSVQRRYAVAFQGTVLGNNRQPHVELFVLDLPNDVERLTRNVDDRLVGSKTTRPLPPSSVQQRRITHTDHRKYPGIVAQPRHWLRSTADGTLIAFLAKDDAGVVQIWAVSPNGGEPRQITRDPHDVASAISISPNGKSIAYVSDFSLFLVEIASGNSIRLTARSPQSPPRPEAVVFSQHGHSIAFLRTVENGTAKHNQLFCVSLERRPN